MPGPHVPLLVTELEIEVQLGEPIDFGITRDGHRRLTPILGGEVRGVTGSSFERLHAEILPGGGDRQLIRPDGTVEIDARYEAMTAGGQALAIIAMGIRRATAEGVYFRAQIRFETSESVLAELQNALFMATGVREADRVLHTVYRVE